jgi:hypothetical protein
VNFIIFQGEEVKNLEICVVVDFTMCNGNRSLLSIYSKDEQRKYQIMLFYSTLRGLSTTIQNNPKRTCI